MVLRRGFPARLAILGATSVILVRVEGASILKAWIVERYRLLRGVKDTGALKLLRAVQVKAMCAGYAGVGRMTLPDSKCQNFAGYSGEGAGQ